MCDCSERLDDKTVIVTGGNQGLGKETAAQLARRGARVILACRDQSSGERVAEEIRKKTDNSSVVSRRLDLSSKASITQFADEIKSSEKRVDVLINNAAICCVPYSKTDDGYEKTMMVNYLGPFLLTYQLLDLLLESAPSRVINVSSHAHVFARLNFNDLLMQRHYSPFKAYCRSKLAQIMHANELGKKLQEYGVTSYSVHPGMLYTERLINVVPFSIPVVGYFARLAYKFISKSVVEGCQTTLYCALSEELAHESGYYYSNCAISTPIITALNRDKCLKLWSVSEELLGLDPSDWPVIQPNEDEDFDDYSEDTTTDNYEQFSSDVLMCMDIDDFEYVS